MPCGSAFCSMEWLNICGSFPPEVDAVTELSSSMVELSMTIDDSIITFSLEIVNNMKKLRSKKDCKFWELKLGQGARFGRKFTWPKGLLLKMLTCPELFLKTPNGLTCILFFTWIKYKDIQHNKRRFTIFVFIIGIHFFKICLSCSKSTFELNLFCFCSKCDTALQGFVIQLKKHKTTRLVQSWVYTSYRPDNKINKSILSSRGGGPAFTGYNRPRILHWTTHFTPHRPEASGFSVK